jgi:hypothetical protein
MCRSRICRISRGSHEFINTLGEPAATLPPWHELPQQWGIIGSVTLADGILLVNTSGDPEDNTTGG